MLEHALSKSAALRGIRRIQSELGEADQKRLRLIAEILPPKGGVRLSDALAALYPKQTRTNALSAFRQFRERLRQAADESEFKLELCVDTQTRAAPEARHCWFEGDDGALEAATEFARTSVNPPERTQQDVIKQAVEIPGKRLVRVFVSYAHADAALKDDLLVRLRQHLAALRHYSFDWWDDGGITPGTAWTEAIRSNISRCDIGLLLVSPAFLASDFIVKEELPFFIPRPASEGHPVKPSVPVAIKAFKMDAHTDLHGLENLQIVFYPRDKAFLGARSDDAKNTFAAELRDRIVAKLQELPPKAQRKAVAARRLDAPLRDEIRERMKSVSFVPTEGRIGSMTKFGEAAAQGERREAIKFLTEWIRDEGAEPCCALLGDTGVGKTTTCMALTQHLLAARETDFDVRLPIYLDLRLLGDAARGEPDLRRAINACLKSNWRSGSPDAVLDADEVIRLVQHEGALVIFDGLDEVLVHLSSAAGQRFTRELLRILPPSHWPGRRKPAMEGRPGRILITCRTHYFRTLRDQQTHFLAEDRDDVKREDYRVFVLLPFSQQQIKDYLLQTIPPENIDHTLATIRAVHNLSELAERPYTLSLLAPLIPDIERWKLQGRTVTGASLYQHMVHSWLERDAGKHQLTPDHKQEVMEYLAAALWRSGKRAWSVGDLEQWLLEFMATRAGFSLHYPSKDPELLKEDLRTATFLVREDSESFRFAHTSLQEFFMAAYLRRALMEGRISDWDMARPSIETLDFLGQLLQAEPDDSATASLRKLRAAYRPRASELAFFYALFAHARGYPGIAPAGFVLDGADLRGWDINENEKLPGTKANIAPIPLNLSGSSFRGARMRNATVRGAILDGCDFTGADLSCAKFDKGRARQALFEAADLTGTVFREMDLEGADFKDSKPYRTQFLKCGMDGVKNDTAMLPHALFAPMNTRQTFRFDASTARMSVLNGHSNAVKACAWSPDGTRIVSGAGDRSLRLWDAQSGECLSVLRGHDGWIRACAWSPDGTCIVSGADDKSLRIWDAKNGKCLSVLSGHDYGVRACAWSPDGTCIVSGSDDETLRIWDAKSGKCLSVLSDREEVVTACFWSPDGTHIVSGFDDGTLRIWDVKSGKILSVLRGHGRAVTACAWSPDGARIVSSSDDSSLRLWDAKSGECLSVLSGHGNAVAACAWSPDGTRIVSGAADNSLRLWDAKSGECLSVLSGHGSAVTACAWSPDSTRIISGSDDSGLRIWDAKNGECLSVLMSDHGTEVAACAWSPDGTRIVFGSFDGCLRLSDAKSGECLLALGGHDMRVSACAWSPDGTHLVSGSFDNSLRLWDAKSGECLLVLSDHDNWVTACAWSPDGTRIVSGSIDHSLRLWDAKNGKCLTVLSGHSSPVMACAWSPDGTRIVSGAGDRSLRLWDAKNGECLSVLSGHRDWVRDCAWSPDGTCIVSCSDDRSLRIWDTESGECFSVLRGHDNWVMACAWSPDGTRIVSGSHDKKLLLWDAKSGECLSVLSGHGDGVVACAWSPDGTRIVSGSFDKSLRLWDAKSGKNIGFEIRYFPDGNFVTLDVETHRVVQASSEAWQWIGWLAPDASGTVTRYPAESLGPYPIFQGEAASTPPRPR